MRALITDLLLDMSPDGVDVVQYVDDILLVGYDPD